LSEDSLLQVERAAARLSQALAAYELGNTGEASRWLEECRPVFENAGEKDRLLQLQMIEGHILFELEKYGDARDVFLSALSTAEGLGNSGERARILNDVGQCAVRLRDLPQAMTYLIAAREAVESEGLTTTREKVFWGFGRVLREQGDLYAAVDQLRKVWHGLLANGSVVDAAIAGLDLVELLSAINENDEATRVAREIVDVFSKAGIQKNVRKALAYLTDEATASARVPLRLDDRIRHLRRFFMKLKHNPMAGFRIPRAVAMALSAH
jgi:tetratricopeptide (TPR) repeat protein